jgi:hypothetical protein
VILYDRVTVVQRELTGYDDYGNPVYSDVETVFPAEVRPLESSETVAGRTQVQTWFRMFLPVAALDSLSSGGAIGWRGKSYEIEGDVEPHSLRGRVHHVELIAKRVSG